MKTGKKLDEGKAPVMTGVFLLFPRSMYELAKISKVGADKYDVTLPDDNFLYVENGANRYMDAHGRHLLDRRINGDLHTETGGELPPEGVSVSHLAQSVWDGLCVLERELKDKEEPLDYSELKIGWGDEKQSVFIGNDFQIGDLYYSCERREEKAKKRLNDLILEADREIIGQLDAALVDNSWWKEWQDKRYPDRTKK